MTAAFYQREILEQSLLEILHQLDACPEPEVREVAGEITEIINAAQDQDCQDHTSEVIDQIKTRLLFMALKQELASETTPTSALRFFCKLKLFFNESVLYKVLATTNDSRGLPLIASRESTEIRGYVKNHLARAVCQFPATHILQRYSSLGRPAAEVMENIENVFRHGINNQADFAQYLTDLFLADRQFMELLQQLDGDLSIRCAKSQSNAELLMEVYDPLTATSGVSEQELLEGAGNVAQTREQWIREDLQQFIDEQIREHWAVITIETSL
ncbi:hypothetical protein NX722_00230 [Endozoicomonas gorgoniicola]|uniref:Uncharacterized protein n=1 Tax=Endozoicomonas gorgoniicola TaxID=1234144 RepID=A0ABT3MP04_9GAMM|nr:hypothetical protein [Endozoicomonas gorgoniicola]MCW7551109.1 hypothetical protein [Endozoicomonas gorgoniicola]